MFAFESGQVYQGGFAVTPHDTNALTHETKAIYVGGTGNLVVTGKDGNDVTFNSVPAGEVLRIAATHVKSTGTTATNIVGLF